MMCCVIGTVTMPRSKRDSSRVVYTSSSGRHGLAMSRSIGDIPSIDVGVIPVPEVSTVPNPSTLQGASSHINFVVCATDGVTDFFSAKELATVVGRGLSTSEGGTSQVDRTQAAQSMVHSIVEEAAARWALEGSYRDDIALVVRRL